MFADVLKKLDALMTEYERNPDLLDASLQGMFGPAILRNLFAQIKQHPEIEAADNGVVLRFKVPKGAKGGLGILEQQERTWHVVWSGDDLVIMPAVQSKTITGDKIEVSRPFGTEKRKVVGTLGIIVSASESSFIPIAMSIESHGPGSRRDDAGITASKRKIADFEARLAANHPGVTLPTFMHISNDNGWLNIRYFQPFAAGDLFDAMSRFETFTQQLLTVYGMARGVAACAQERIIHKDLKPENFLCDIVNGNPVIYVADFGAACDFGSADSLGIGGTFTYMPPEVFLAYATRTTIPNAVPFTNADALNILIDLREENSEAMGLMLGLDYAILRLMQKIADGKADDPADKPIPDEDGAIDRFALGFMVFEMFLGQERTNLIAQIIGELINEFNQSLLRGETVDPTAEISSISSIIEKDLLELADRMQARDSKTADAIKQLIPIVQSLLSPDPQDRMLMPDVMQQVTQILTTAGLGPNIQQIQQRQQQQVAALQIPQQGPITALVAKAKTTNNWAEDFREYVTDINIMELISFSGNIADREGFSISHFQDVLNDLNDWLLSTNPNTINVLKDLTMGKGEPGTLFNKIKEYKAKCDAILQQLDILRAAARAQNKKYPETALAAEQQLRFALELFKAICDKAAKRPGATPFAKLEASAPELDVAISAMVGKLYSNRFGMKT